MIDFDKKFIFMHIPRTGGSSIEKALGGKLQDHRKPRMYQLDHGLNIFDNFFSFMVVRNTWDKVVSLYCYQRGHRNSMQEEFHPVKNMTFTEYINALASDTKLSNFDMHQHNWLVDHEGKDVTINQILRFENLKIDFDTVCKKIGVDALLPHENKTNRAHYSVYYNSYTKDIVGNIFKKDIDFFDYKFEN